MYMFLELYALQSGVIEQFPINDRIQMNYFLLIIKFIKWILKPIVVLLYLSFHLFHHNYQIFM